MVPFFRAWDKSRNLMSIVDRWYLDTKGVQLMDDFGLYWKRFSEVILMQGTELKYWNTNKNVYVGDICNIHWFYQGDGVECEKNIEKATIVEEYGSIGFWCEDDFYTLAQLEITCYLHEESFEYLGNIYENHELLEED